MITEQDADRWITQNKDRHQWSVPKMMVEFSKDKVKEVVKEIHSQSKDEPITEEWVGFKTLNQNKDDE
jgi:Zn-finger protein